MGMAAVDRDWSRRLAVGRSEHLDVPLTASTTTFNVPEICDPFIWRLLTSEYLKVASPTDLDRWSFNDLVEAHAYLDAIDEAVERTRKD
jgi:hypothetical protein